jgi:hypothetical protein
LTKQQVFFGILWLTKTQGTVENPHGFYQPASNQDVNENGLIFELGSLYDDLPRVSDTRKPKGKLYSLPLLLLLMILSKLGM